MATTADKRELVLFKTRMGMSITITKTDIVPITCRYWDKSFARTECGKRAMARSVWRALNRALLLSPEILNTNIVVSVEEDDGEQQEGQYNNQQITRTTEMQDNACARSELSASIIPRASVDSLNLAIGLSGSIIMDLLHNALKDEKVTDNLMQ